MVTGQVEIQVQEVGGAGKATVSPSRSTSLRHPSDTSLFALLLRDRLTSGAGEPSIKQPELERRKPEEREWFAAEAFRSGGNTPDELNSVGVIRGQTETIHSAPTVMENSALSSTQGSGESNPAVNLTERATNRQNADALSASPPKTASQEKVKAHPAAPRSSSGNGQEYGVTSGRTVSSGVNRRRSLESAAQKVATSPSKDKQENLESIAGQRLSSDSTGMDLPNTKSTEQEITKSITAMPLAVVVPSSEAVTAAVVTVAVSLNGTVGRKAKGVEAAVTPPRQVPAAAVARGKASPAKGSDPSAEKPITRERVRTPKLSAEPVTPIVVAPEAVNPEVPAVNNTAGAVLSSVAARQEIVRPVEKSASRSTESKSRPQGGSQPAVILKSNKAVSEPVVTALESGVPASVTDEVDPLTSPPPSSRAIFASAPVAPRQEISLPVQSATTGTAQKTTRSQVVAVTPQRSVKSLAAAAASVTVKVAPVVGSVASAAPAAVTTEVAPAVIAPVVGSVASAAPAAVTAEVAPAVIAPVVGSVATAAPAAVTGEVAPVAAPVVGSVASAAPAAVTGEVDVIIPNDMKGNSQVGSLALSVAESAISSVNNRTQNPHAESNVIQIKPMAVATKVPRKGIPVDSDNSDPMSTQRTISGDGKLTSAKVDVTFTNSFSGDSSTSDDKEHPSFQGNGQKPTHNQLFSMTSPPVAEMREPVPASTSSRDEVRSELKENILTQVKHAEILHDSKGTGHISIKLNPEDLGELTINVRVDEQRLKVEVISENRSVREALMNNMESLKETLIKQHFTMERFDVSTGANSHGSNQAFPEGSGEQRNNNSRQFTQKVELADLSDSRGVHTGENEEESLINVLV